MVSLGSVEQWPEAEKTGGMAAIPSGSGRFLRQRGRGRRGGAFARLRSALRCFNQRRGDDELELGRGHGGGRGRELALGFSIRKNGEERIEEREGEQVRASVAT